MTEAIGNQNTNNPNNTTVLTPVQLQQQNYDTLGETDWYEFKINEHAYFQKWLAYAVYGVPTMTDPIPGCIFGYNKSQSNEIKKLYDVFLRNHFRREPNIFVRLVYIVCTPVNKTNIISQNPVFIIKKCEKEDKCEKEGKCEKEDKCEKKDKCMEDVPACVLYVDQERRIYNSWMDYLEENRLPACLMHCPKNGKYTVDLQDIVELEVVKSPAATLGKKVLVGTDIAGAVAGTASTGVLVAASVTALTVAPVVVAGAVATGAVIGIYSIGRSIATLVDRKKHKQSIGLDNNESRLCWLNTTVGTLGTVTSAAAAGITVAAKRGIDISKSAQITFNTLQGVTAVGSGVSIGYSVVNIIMRKRNNEPIDTLEVIQLCASVFFFYQSTVNFKTAKTIISETQHSVLQDYEASLRSNRHRKAFRKAQLESQRVNGEAKGKTEIIRGIRNINDRDNFFAGLVRMNKDLNESGVRYTITENGRVALNSAYVIDPAEFANLPRQARQERLAGLPARQPTMRQSMPEAVFNVRLSQMQDIFERFVTNNPQALLRGLMNIGDTRFLTAFLRDFSERAIEFLFQILDGFLAQIHDELNAVARIYPFLSKPIIAVQYLVDYIRGKAKEYKLQVQDYIKTFFTEDDVLIPSSIGNIVENCRLWNNAVEERYREPVVYADEWANKTVTEHKCSVCSGTYFQREA